MLQSKSKITVPFLCCCFWTIIFSVFLSYFFHLSAPTNTKIGNERVCADIPLQNQYQLVKEEYIWRGIENITDVVFQQPCPNSQVGHNLYYTNVYIGGIYETTAKQSPSGDVAFILNCRGEIIYTFSNLTIHDSSGGIVGTLDFEDVPLVLTNPEGERVAHWCLDSKTITLVIHSEIDRILLFAIAGKYAFREYNECTKYWMSLQIVLISGILSIISMIAVGIVMCTPHRYARSASAFGGARKNLKLKTFN